MGKSQLRLSERRAMNHHETATEELDRHHRAVADLRMDGGAARRPRER